MKRINRGYFVGLVVFAVTVLLSISGVWARSGKPGMLLGGSGLLGEGKSKVYFGAHKGQPVLTRVLAVDSDAGEGKRGLLLLSEESLERVVFDDGSSRIYSNQWEGSSAQGWCRDFYASGFTPGEKAAILPTTKRETGDLASLKPSNLYGDYVYFLSAQEATNQAYGFSAGEGGDPARGAQLKGAGEGYPWWLRSAFTGDLESVGAADERGLVLFLNHVLEDWGGRPAFHVDGEAVLFASAAVGGKATGETGSGALLAVAENETEEWKLTLLDESRGFAVGRVDVQTVKAGERMVLSYTGAKSGAGEYVSAVLADSRGAAVYYGRIKAVAAGEEKGQAEVILPDGLVNGEYTLHVFNEQVNGDKETDYASAMAAVPLTAEGGAESQEEQEISQGSLTPTDAEGVEPKGNVWLWAALFVGIGAVLLTAVMRGKK